ncbi:MAG TPA: translocation/assembly module TamB domain-containing protein [Chitinophagaceae bacterium]|nr:translocation/assembly module TamB domain-containing protein [Chitinophagaceae bacterium]
MDQAKKRNWVKPARIVAKTVLFIALFLLVILLLLQTGPVQSMLRVKAVAYLEKKLQTKVQVGRVYIGLPKNIILENIYIEDREKDTLLSGGKIEANLDLLRLLFNNEIDIKSISLDNITAKIKRQLPDTVFNFQFVVDAFATKDSLSGRVDTSSYFIAVPSIELNKIRIIYKDTVSGSDMEAWLDHLDTRIDKMPARLSGGDYEHLYFDIPKTNINGLIARIYQSKPLVKLEPEIKDMVEARQPFALQLFFKEMDLQNIKVDYRNDVSGVYSTIDLKALNVKPNTIDLNNRIIDLQTISLNNTTAAIRLLKKEEAKIVVKEVEQEAKSQREAGWRISASTVNFTNNSLQFDNDNNPRTGYGMDYGHLKGDSLTLEVNDFLLSYDSIAGKIKKANFKEQSGFVLNELQADFLYSDKQTYIKDLLLKTPGTELKRFASLTYSSFKDLSENFPSTQIDADISNSHVQVKDILAFAPQLRSQPAFANPNATWYINLQGNGTLQTMYIRNLQFRGLKNTQIDASGSLATNNDPNRTGARLTIRKLHITQSDIALFTGQRLSNAQINFPEEFDAHGTVAGTINNLSTNLTINSSVGTAFVNGRFTNLSNPPAATYNALVKTNALDLGSILRNEQIGNVSANVTVSGKGFTPDKMNTKFKGDIYSIAYNDYVYRNINVDGSLQGSSFNVITDINDPNITFNGTISGDMSSNPSFRFAGMLDSIKTFPLGLTPEPLIARGKIDGNIPVMNANYLEADVLMTEALLVTGSQRLPLDTIQFISGRNDTAQFMTLRSDVANARLSGQYRYTDLGMIVRKSIEPYFSVTPASAISTVQPYNFSFTADISNAPALTAFVPGLESFEPIHIDGRASSDQGLSATMTSPYIFYNGSEINGINVRVNTTDRGLQFVADVQHIQGIGHNLYHTQLNATALNNKIDFNLDIDDINGRDKYFLSGILTQPTEGNYTLSLRPDSLLLNYERWTVSANNSLTITKDNILANNFILQKNDQRLSLQSQGQQLNVGFTNFQLSTITAIMKSDSLLVNGSMNGQMVFTNILKQPVFTSDLTINDLSMKGDTIGNAVVKVDNISGNRYNTNATITGRGNDISLTGSFAPQGENDIALDLDLAVRQLQLATLEGAFGNMIKNASGGVNGNITIKGTAKEPKINGPINFDKASFATTILGSQYRIDGEKINVTENGFQFDDFVIKDTANNEMRLNGSIQTPNFTNYNFDFDLNATNFQILNTTKKDNKIYYGKLVITSDMHVSGTESAPDIDGNITVNDGTDLSVVIPQQEPGVVAREGIVEFVDMDVPGNDSLFLDYDSLNIAPFRGMNIISNIEIKKEAIFNIIIDEANGDFINVQGEAVLSTGIDPSGKITLVGNYELEKGAYEITFNFLRRRFDIQKGSRITWLNEPTKATLDVNATYIANTAPIDLVQNQIAASSQAIRNTYLQKLPFEVRLKMTGELMKPELAFDIVLPLDKNYGVSNDIITQVDRRLQELRQEPGETNRQVFALLLLNRFVGQNPLASSTPMFSATSYARQSVSKLMTEQLNKLAAGLIDGVDLTFDVTSTDDYTTGEQRSRTDLNIGLSKRLLNERLTVSVGSNFELEGPKNSNQKANNVFGDLIVNYSLSPDGRYMIRFYRKNRYEGIVDGYIIETGLSFLISVDYNRFSELLRKRKNQRVDGVNYQNRN